MERDFLLRWVQLQPSWILAAQDLADILAEGGYACGLFPIDRIALEQMPVFLDHRPAARCRDHDGFGAAFNTGPPGIDVAPGAVQRIAMVAKVITERAAAAGARDAL